MIVSGFDWDDGNRRKCQKHGVSIEEIEELFRRGPRVAPDPRHSQLEVRFIAIGRTAAGQPVFIAFTFRRKSGQHFVRPISARYMHKAEIDAYEKKSSTAED